MASKKVARQQEAVGVPQVASSSVSARAALVDAADVLAGVVVHEPRVMRQVSPHEALQLQRAVGNRVAGQALARLGQQSSLAAIQRGLGSSKPKEEYYTFSADDVEYRYVWAQDSADGGVIDVFSENEEERIGYAAFSLENKALQAGPGAAEAYTKAHVLGRVAGIVCHLNQIMNLSLTRDGPDHIYRGFANTLMQMVEVKARARGARLIYLEPAKSAVRTDPNTNDKQMQDPTAFYTTKHGYSLDAAATLHNATVVDTMYAGMGLPVEQVNAQKGPFNLAQLGGMLSKAL